MPIGGVGTWIPTIDEFITHWTAVNAALSPLEFKLFGAYTLANFTTDRGNLVTQLADVEAKTNLRQTAGGDRDVKRASIRPRILQFGPTVRGVLPGTRYLKSIPKTPQFNYPPGIWRTAMNDMANLWNTINFNIPPVSGFTPPLLLSSGYTQANFVTEQSAMDAAFTTVETTDQNAQQSRAQRDVLFKPIYQRLKQYRLAVCAALPVGNALCNTVPALTPAPGTTPDPVSLSGSWNVTTDLADLLYTASADPNLDHYSLRYHPGPRYKADEEQTVDSNPPGTLEFNTAFGLPASGSVAWFKVYVVLTTGNERGSNSVKITRP